MGLCSSAHDEPNPRQLDLSHFKKLRPLGKGSYGIVEAVAKRGSPHTYALKKLNKTRLAKNPEQSQRRVMRERNVNAYIARLCSPFLIPLHHAFQDESWVYFVMDLIPGGELRYHLNNCPFRMMPEPMVRFYAAEILVAIEQLHSAHIVHRDIKPENILLDARGHIRLSDLGLAVLLNPTNNYQVAGPAGTYYYIAPEVWSGDGYGLSADVYSFGSLLYELIHGDTPDLKWREKLEKRELRYDNPETERLNDLHLNSSISAELRDLLKGLLEVDPRKRLGCGRRGIAELRSHPWFAGVEWYDVERQALDPPIVPDLREVQRAQYEDMVEALEEEEAAEGEEEAEQSKPTDTSKKPLVIDGFEYRITIHRKSSRRNRSRASASGASGSRCSFSAVVPLPNLGPVPSPFSGSGSGSGHHAEGSVLSTVHSQPSQLNSTLTMAMVVPSTTTSTHAASLSPTPVTSPNSGATLIAVAAAATLRNVPSVTQLAGDDDDDEEYDGAHGHAHGHDREAVGELKHQHQHQRAPSTSRHQHQQQHQQHDDDVSSITTEINMSCPSSPAGAPAMGADEIEGMPASRQQQQQQV